MRLYFSPSILCFLYSFRLCWFILFHFLFIFFAIFLSCQSCQIFPFSILIVLFLTGLHIHPAILYIECSSSLLLYHSSISLYRFAIYYFFSTKSVTDTYFSFVFVTLLLTYFPLQVYRSISSDNSGQHYSPSSLFLHSVFYSPRLHNPHFCCFIFFFFLSWPSLFVAQVLLMFILY